MDHVKLYLNMYMYHCLIEKYLVKPHHQPVSSTGKVDQDIGLKWQFSRFEFEIIMKTVGDYTMVDILRLF